MRESFFSNNSGRGTRKSQRQTGYSIPMAGWLCVSFVGLVAGYVAGIIDIGTGWLKDLKEGICPEAFYLNREQCCWSSNDTMLEMHNCAQWKTWPQLLGINSPDSYVGVFISYVIYVLFSVALAGLAALLVKTFAPYACGSGIPEIKSILSGFQIKGYLGKWTLIIKSICVSLVVASGMSLGKEGPLVHISCCIGNFFTHWPCFAKYGKDEAKKMEILSAASAAGVSVAFGAPIGGVLFSLEEVSNYFPLKTLWRSFFCALIAAFVLRSINPFGNEHLVKFYVDYTRPWVLFELIPFVFLGICGGILGTILIKGNIRWCRYRKDNKLGQYPITEVIVVAAITALLAFPNEFTRMDSSDLIRLLFSQCGIVDFSDLCDYKRNFTNVNKKLLNNAEAGPGVYKSIYLLVLALIFKLVITVFTFGMKVPTGIFIPSMSLGAIMGRVIGIFMEQLAFRYPKLWFFQGACSTGVNCMTPGLYAMVGAAATLAGVTRMTVSLVVIMFELTGSVEFIVPLMSAVMASKWMGDALDKQGIYDAHIQLNGYPFLDSKEEYSSTTVAADCMKLTKMHQTPLILITQDAMTIEDLDNLLCNSNYNGYPVVVSQESQYLVGFVSRRELQSALSFAKRTNELYKNTRVIFYGDSENMVSGDGLPQPLNLRKIVDLSPITITDRTPMVTVIDMFRKLSLRQVLVTHNGRLLGIITKKDVLRHIKQLSNEDPDSILFN